MNVIRLLLLLIAIILTTILVNLLVNCFGHRQLISMSRDRPTFKVQVLTGNQIIISHFFPRFYAKPLYRTSMLYINWQTYSLKLHRLHTATSADRAAHPMAGAYGNGSRA